MENTYVAVDLETTGLNPKMDRIIEIGAIKVKNGIVQDMFHKLINPERKIRRICGTFNRNYRRYG